MIMNPSDVCDYPWIRCFDGSKDYVVDNRYTGKWLIFVRKDDADHLWNIISTHTRSGSLGIQAKISTNYPSHHDDRVICVYTYDYRDQDDVFRVRKKLITLGIKEQLVYKTDDATRQGLYASNGDHVALYKM